MHFTLAFLGGAGSVQKPISLNWIEMLSTCFSLNGTKCKEINKPKLVGKNVLAKIFNWPID